MKLLITIHAYMKGHNMEDLDIQNAITTLNTIYFFKCARKQGYTQTALENVLIHLFNFPREKATLVIYSAAPHYHQTNLDEKCINFLIKYTRRTALN